MANSKIPVHKDIRISKSVLPQLPSDFKNTKLGYSRKGAVAQYRGPNAIHVHEYPGYWVFHRDCSDPRTFKGGLAHLLFDAPEIPLAIVAGSVSGIGVGKIVYKIRKSRSKNAKKEATTAGTIASLASGIIAYFLARKK